MITSKNKGILSASFLEIPILGVEYIDSMKRSFVFNKDGSIGTMMKVEGINDSSFVEEDYLRVNRMLSQAIKNLDTNEINCQFMLINSIDNTIPNCTLENLPPHLIERNRFLREEMVKNGEVFKKEFYISFNCVPSPREEGFFEGWSRKIKNIIQSFQSTVSLEAIDSKFSEALTIGRIRKLNTTAKSFTSSLKELNCKYNDELTKEEVVGIYRSILARSKYDANKPFIVDDADFKRSLLSGTRTYEKPFSHVVHDDYFFRTYSLDRVSSSEWISGDQMKAILNTNSEYIYTVNFRLMDHRESSKKVDRKLAFLRFVNGGNDTGKKVENAEVAIEMNEAEEIRQRFAEGGSYGVECSISFTYMINEFRRSKIKEEEMLDDDEYVLDLDQKLHHSNFGKVAQSEWVALPGQWQILCLNLPGVTNVASPFVDTMIELPDNLAYLLPVYDQKRLDLKHYGVNHFYTDYNTIVPYEYFDKAQDSFVTLIFGVMGTGKSVTINLILSLLYQSRAISGKDPVVRGLDFGGVAGSYYKLAKLMGGTILNFSTSKKPKINPFKLSDIQRYPTPLKKESIKDFIFLMKKSKGDSIPEEEELEHSIDDYYNDLLGFEDRITDKIKYTLIEKHFAISEDQLIDDEGRVLPLVDILVLNPGECEPNVDSMNLISGIIEVMLSPTFDRVTVDYERSQVVRLIQLLYRSTEGRFPYLNDFFELIKKLDPDSIFLGRLSKWVNGGTYRMFDGEGDIDLTSDFVLFDMYGLDKDPQLKMIYTALIAQLIIDDMYKKMDRSRVFIGDEIWAALESDTLRKFIVAFSRTSRKYKFGMILATQLPTDFFDASGSDGEKIVSLANNFIFCGFRDRSIINKTCSLYGLPNGMRETLSKMGVADGEEGSVVKKFSRFVMVSNKKSGKEISIFRNILSPLEYQLYSSSKEDNAIVKYYHEVNGAEILSALKFIASGRHIGDEGLIEYLTKNNHFEALEMVQKKRS